MKILLTGKNGQVGWELQHALAPLGEVIACDRSELDLSNPDQIAAVVRETKPQIIVNAAAYTAVDKAESEPELAHAINGHAPGILADEAKKLGALLVHYSTDYVFDGNKAEPYTEEDTPNPLSAYGRTKLAGEEAIQASGCRHLIFRTSWVYGFNGSNFPKTILRLAQTRTEIKVVDDQFGAPTSSTLIADATATLVDSASKSPTNGILNLTSAGQTSWYNAALLIKRVAGVSVAILPIKSSEFPTAAKRPHNSRLSLKKILALPGITLPNWESELTGFIKRLGS